MKTVYDLHRFWTLACEIVFVLVSDLDIFEFTTLLNRLHRWSNSRTNSDKFCSTRFHIR